MAKEGPNVYFRNWQQNRINFILSKYPVEFFKNKKILELGSYNGYISNYFKELGSDVLVVEGRQENCDIIKSDYPDINVECYDLDTPDWKFGKWDIIINFGLYYHLEKFHEEHMINCINNCNIMFFESVIFDSDKSEIFFDNEIGQDQSLSNVGGTPTRSYVENIFKKLNVDFEYHPDGLINGDSHIYNWAESNSNELCRTCRRFWIVKNGYDE
jgi:hypothetical protein